MDLGQTNNTAQNDSYFPYIYFTVTSFAALGICLIGLVGNIILFWRVCFKISRNNYTIYIINLAVANSIFLVFSAILLMLTINSMIGIYPDFHGKEKLHLFVEICYDSIRYSGMFILTVITLERCISALFPLWYQSHRPQNLPTIICVVLWTTGCLESLLENLVCKPEGFFSQTSECTGVEIMTFVLAVGFCLPIMVLSSLTLLVKMWRKSNQQVSRELYAFVIVAVIVFILFVIPFYFLWLLMYFQMLPTGILTISLFFASIYFSVLNCTLNPYIYFYSERKWTLSSLKLKTINNTDATSCNRNVNVIG